MGVFMGRDLFSAPTQLRELRERAGLSLEELAKSLGLQSAEELGEYENEENESIDYFSTALTEKMARILIGLGKPAIRSDEVWALAVPDARTRLLANRKEAYNESVTVRIPPEIVTGQLAANIMDLAAGNAESTRKPKASKKRNEKTAKSCPKNRRKNGDNADRRKSDRKPNEQQKFSQSKENVMKTHYQPLVVDAPFEAVNDSRFNNVEDNLVDFEQNRILPVYGQTVAGEHGEFDLDGNILYEVACPPQLNHAVNAYALEVSGETMWPRYQDGEIVYCDPTRRVKKGDFVVAQVIADDHSAAPKAFVKMFSHHTDKELVLEQFNPPRKLVFPHEKVLSVHAITFSGTAAAEIL